MVTRITRTIGPSGRDYASFTLAEADVENIGTSADLVANDEAIVFEADAGTYSETVNFTSTLVTDATRKVTYKPAAGAEHGGVNGAGALLLCSSAMFFNDDFTEFQGIEVKLSGSTGNCFDVNAVAIFNGCILSGIVQRPGSTTTTNRTTVANCLFTDCVTAINIFNYGDSYVDVANCTLVNNQALGVCRFIILGATSGNTCEVTLTNILSFGTNNYSVSSSAGTVTVTGGGCFYSLYQPFPAATLGSPNPITASTAYDPGAGDFALYVGKNGALLDSPNNDVIGGGVGPSVNSDVPTTDILGNPRSGATANPGAFEVPQATATLTRTIGPVGRDYASFTLAEADVTNIGGSADLVNENERIVFEADAATYVEGVNVISSLTTDATRQVTYKPAAGSEHGGDFSAGVRVVFNTAGNGCFNIDDDFTHIVGLVCTTDTGAVGNRGLIQPDASGLVVDGCILQVEHSNPWCLFSNQGGSTAANVYQNNLLRNANQRPISLYSIAAPTSHEFINNTIEGHGDRAIFYQVLGNSMTVEAVNNFIFNVNNWAQGNSSGGATFTTTGSNNVIDVVGSNMGSGVAVLECTATTSFSTPLASGDYAVYMGSNASLANVAGNDAWGIGVGPSVNSDVPTTDINGVARSGATCNPGAFEADGFVAPTVLTRTIGSGKDYASFSLAEADVTNIGGSADLTFENEAIVFEADAGTYTTGSTQYIAASTLVTDATRNVTYTKAAGPVEYVYTGGGAAIDIYDAYTVWSGIDLTYSGSRGIRIYSQSGFPAGAPGVTIRDVTVAPAVSGGVAFGCEKLNTTYPLGTAAEPIRILNCVTKSLVAVGNFFPGTGHTTGAHALVVNCTHLGDGVGANQVWNWVAPSGAPDASFKIINCANLASTASNDANILGGGVDVSGSGYNVGNSAAPTSSFRFENINGGIGDQYTPTTNTSPGAGDWAIYEAATGQLYFAPENDVWRKGAGPDFNPLVPTTDIQGVARIGTRCNPGAFETGLPVIGGSPPPGIIDAGNSTVTTSDATGKVADGKDAALVTATVKDASNNPISNAQVWISDASQVPFISPAYKPAGADTDGTYRSPDPVTTDADGVAAFYVYGLKAHTQQFTVEAGAFINEWNASVAPLQRPTEAEVGDKSFSWSATYTGDQTIDAAWLATYGSNTVNNVRFTGGTVTVASDAARFTNCTFNGSNLPGRDYTVVCERNSDPSGGANSTFVSCTISGGYEAGIRMHRTSMYLTLVYLQRGHGIYITPNAAASAQSRIATCIVRSVGSNSPTGKSGIYMVDACKLDVVGCSLQCAHPSSSGGSSVFNSTAALYIAAVDDPVLDVYVYTGWIDGNVRLKDGGLGIGPEGMMMGDIFFSRNYAPGAPLLENDCSSIWSRANFWEDTGDLIQEADGGQGINTFPGIKEANVWPRVSIGTVSITWDSAYANLPVTLNGLVPPTKPPTTQPVVTLTDMSTAWFTTPSHSVAWRTEPESDDIYIPQIVHAVNYYQKQIGWNDGNSSGPHSYNPPLIVVPLVRRDGSPLDLLTGPGGPPNPTA